MKIRNLDSFQKLRIPQGKGTAQDLDQAIEWLLDNYTYQHVIESIKRVFAKRADKAVGNLAIKLFNELFVMFQRQRERIK